MQHFFLLAGSVIDKIGFTEEHTRDDVSYGAQVNRRGATGPQPVHAT